MGFPSEASLFERPARCGHDTGVLTTMISRSVSRFAMGCALLSILLVAGCASGRGKSSTAVAHVAAVERVLSVLGDGVRLGDVDAMVALWRPADREAARKAISAGLSDVRVEGLRMDLIGVRVEGDRTTAQVTWSGRLAGESVNGRFGLSLTGKDSLSIISVAGELPWAIGGRGDALSPDWPVRLGR